MTEEKLNLSKIKIVGICLSLYPLILALIGKILVINGFSRPEINFEEDELIKNFLYILYFLGLAVFFFCGGFSDYISRKIFSNKKNISEKKQVYFSYIILMFSFLNIISTTGFIGFLICGNFAFLGTFSLINFLSLFSYFPTRKRYEKKLEIFN
jgi:uncharacterized membrane protein